MIKLANETFKILSSFAASVCNIKRPVKTLFSLCSRRFREKDRYFIYKSYQCHDSLRYFGNYRAEIPLEIELVIRRIGRCTL